MKAKVDPCWFAEVCNTLINSDAKTAIKYISEKAVVKATWRHKPHGKNIREEMVVTFGRPGYLEQKFVRLCTRAREPFPIALVQLKPWPKKRKVK